MHKKYIGWDIFEEYAVKGSIAVKKDVLKIINELLPDKQVKTNLPVQGVVTLMGKAMTDCCIFYMHILLREAKIWK